MCFSSVFTTVQKFIHVADQQLVKMIHSTAEPPHHKRCFQQSLSIFGSQFINFIYKSSCWFRLFLKCAVLVKSYLCLNCTPLHDAFFQVHCNHQRHRCACHKKLLRFKHVAIGLNEHVCNVFNLFFSVYVKNAINFKGHCAVPENIYMHTHPKKG